MVTLVFQVAECSVIMGETPGMHLMCYEFENNLLTAGAGACFFTKFNFSDFQKYCFK
jgi:hypothetical protein